VERGWRHSDRCCYYAKTGPELHCFSFGATIPGGSSPLKHDPGQLGKSTP
jgi:hypothetical protein